MSDAAQVLLAACRRHLECQNWSTADNLRIPLAALDGEPWAIRALNDSCWHLTADGELPTDPDGGPCLDAFLDANGWHRSPGLSVVEGQHTKGHHP